MVEVSDVDDVGLHPVQYGSETPVYLHMPVPVPASHHVDYMKRHPFVIGVPLLRHFVFGSEAVFLSREYMYFVVGCQCLC